MVTPAIITQSAVHLLEPLHDLAQAVTFGSSWDLPIAQSVGFTHAPMAVPHAPASSPGGSDASIAPPAAPPEPVVPPAPAEPPAAAVDPVAADEPPDAAVVAVDPELVEPEPALVVAAVAPAPPPPSLPPPQATSAAPKSQHQRVPPNLWLDIE